MNRKNIIEALDQLGKHLQHLTPDQLEKLAKSAANENSWFTIDSIQRSFIGATNYLNRDKLEKWVAPYPRPSVQKRIGLVLAGNIPLVGLHDIISVLVSGHVAMIKPSSKDSALVNYLVNTLNTISPEVASRIILVDQLREMDAIIATGSDNTARYFHQYFGKYPHVIRKNRSSVAILRGSESAGDLRNLGTDIFAYFGLGCRNVSKLFVPEGYVFENFFNSVEGFNNVMTHHKYHHNYDYHKSILLVNKERHLDNGFLLLQPSDRLVSPISVVYYETYENTGSLESRLGREQEKIQCVVSGGGWFPGSVAMGQTQMPELWDYADQVDTMKFLAEL